MSVDIIDHLNINSFKFQKLKYKLITKIFLIFFLVIFRIIFLYQSILILNINYKYILINPLLTAQRNYVSKVSLIGLFADIIYALTL